MNACMHEHLRSCVRACVHACMLARMHACMHEHVRSIYIYMACSHELSCPEGVPRSVLGETLMGHPWALIGRALMGPPGCSWAGPLWAALGPLEPGPCGPPLGACGPPCALVGPLGHLWPGGPPWALVGRAPVGPRWALVGRTLMGLPGRPGPSWARP